MRAARLTREVIVVARQHVAIQSQANFHQATPQSPRRPHEYRAGLLSVLCGEAFDFCLNHLKILNHKGR